MNTTFVNEAECYEILKRYGLSTPHYIFIDSTDNLQSMPFENGQDVVFKAVIDDVWHKSDLGLISFNKFSQKTVQKYFEQFYHINPKKENWKGLLVCEKLNSIDGLLPCDVLLSVRHDPSCGAFVTMGFGGIHTELWAKAVKESVLNFMVELSTVEDALAELSNHLLGRILLGKVRNGVAFVTQQRIKSLLTSIWQLAANMQKEGLALIEINPLIIDQDGHIIAIDGVGQRYGQTKAAQSIRVKNIPVETQLALFNPQTIVIAGLSSKKKAFGNIILDNLKNSGIANQNITVLKAGSSGFDGFHTIDALEELSHPVDALILAVPAQEAIPLIKDVFRSQKVKVIHLVAGGIGDGADHSGLKEQLAAIIAASPTTDRPYIVGPNSLGMILAPQKINTLFIPHNKLPVSFYPDGNVALVAQSGAFFITRLSKNDDLAIRYGLCIGNQIDISATDIVTSLATDTAIEVIGLYLEGAPQGNALELAKAIKSIADDKRVVIYRAGRSGEGMKAAAGHTGALASDYNIEKKLLMVSGATVCESFDHFNNYLKWYSVYPNFKSTKQVSVISNAGYESVAGADGLGKKLTNLSEKTKKDLTKTLSNHKLSEIVVAANPLDITPMASDDVFYECSRIILQAAESKMLILCLVPLTPMIETDDWQVMIRNASRIKKLAGESKKPIAVVIDAGNDYIKLKQAFSENGLPVFNSIQDVFKIIT